MFFDIFLYYQSLQRVAGKLSFYVQDYTTVVMFLLLPMIFTNAVSCALLFFFGLALIVCSVVLYSTFLIILSFHFLNVFFYKFEVNQNHVICLVQSFSTLAVFSLTRLLFNGTAGLGSCLDFSQLWDYWGLHGHCCHFILIPIFPEECELFYGAVALCKRAFHLLICSHFLCIDCIQNLKSLLLLFSPSNNVYQCILRTWGTVWCLSD